MMSHGDQGLVFSCMNCPEKFDSLYSLNQHHGSKHKGKKFDD